MNDWTVARAVLDDRQVALAERRGHVRPRVEQLHPHRVLVDLRDPVRVDHVDVAARGSHVRIVRVENALQRVDDVVDRQWGSVVELDPLLDPDRPHARVLVRLDGRGELVRVASVRPLISQLRVHQLTGGLRVLRRPTVAVWIEIVSAFAAADQTDAERAAALRRRRRRGSVARERTRTAGDPCCHTDRRAALEELAPGQIVAPAVFLFRSHFRSSLVRPPVRRFARVWRR
jgi:hypothetical protein